MSMSLANVAYRMATEETFLQAVQRWSTTGAQSELESLAVEDQTALKGLIATGTTFDQLLAGYEDPGPTTEASGWWRP